MDRYIYSMYFFKNVFGQYIVIRIRYETKLHDALRAGVMRGTLTGLGGGVMWLIIYSSYAL